MNVILFIAPKNKGFASVAKKFCDEMGWKPLVIDLEKPYESYKKQISKLKEVDVIISAGFRDGMILHAKEIKEKFKDAKVIQFSNPRYEDWKTMPLKEIGHLDVIIDWEKNVNKKQIPKHTKLISLNRPPSSVTEKQLKKLYKGHLKNDLLIHIGSSLEPITIRGLITSLDNLLSIRKFDKVYVSYNTRSYLEETKEGENIVDFVFFYLKSKNIKFYDISKFTKFLKRLVNKSYIAQMGNSQVISDALYISKILKLKRYHIVEGFDGNKGLSTFIKDLQRGGWVCNTKSLKKSDLSTLVDTMDIMVKEVKKIL